MSDLDLAHEARAWTPGLIAQHAVSAHDTIKRMADRIESLEAERDAAVFAEKSMDRMHDIAEARADRAEARLARVTDDSMVEQVASVLAMSYGSHVSPPKGGRDWRAAEDVLAAIRAVAADEQVCGDYPAPCNHDPAHEKEA